eukprot:762023-Prorocentrum_minimum.AAC.3
MGGPIGTHLKRGFESWQNSSKRKPKPLQTKEGKGKMRFFRLVRKRGVYPNLSAEVFPWNDLSEGSARGIFHAVKERFPPYGDGQPHLNERASICWCGGQILRLLSSERDRGGWFLTSKKKSIPNWLVSLFGTQLIVPYRNG